MTQGGAPTLQRLVDALQSAETLEATLDAAVRTVPEIVGVTQCTLFLCDTVDNRLLPVAAYGLDPGALATFYTLGGPATVEAMRRAIETGEPVVARADRDDFGIPDSLAERFRIRALLIVPLLSVGQVVGAMGVQTPDHAADFTDEIVALACGAALHVAGAIHVARLVRESEGRFKETAARLAVSNALGSTVDTIETMRRIAREVGRALGADMVGAFLADNEGAALRPIAGYHVPRELIPSFLEFPLPIKGSPQHEELWQTGRAFWSADAATDPRFDPEMMRRFPHRSNLVAPMTAHGVPVGALVVLWWRDARVVTPDELRLVESISDQAATFLANARLYEALEDRLEKERDTRLSLERSERRQAALGEIVKDLAAERTLEELLALVGHRACELFDADAAMIGLIEGDDVVLRGHWGVPDLDAITTRRPLAETRVARVIRDRRPYATPDLAVDPVWRDSSFTKAGYRAGLEAPILLRGDAIGVIGVLQRMPRSYTAEDIRLLSAFAEHAALAVDRAHLRAQRESRLRETERLLDVSQATAATLDVTEVARRTVREMAHALAADVGRRVDAGARRPGPPAPGRVSHSAKGVLEGGRRLRDRSSTSVHRAWRGGWTRRSRCPTARATRGPTIRSSAASRTAHS